tara:strand:- start:7062 stop:7490 length:429 start_codon:yes stop_codon:yes gene_type:complete
MLLLPKNFSGNPLAPVPHHRVTNAPGCNNSKTAQGIRSLDKLRQKNGEDKGRTLESPARSTHLFKFSGTTQVLPSRESKMHSARETSSLGRKTFPAFAAARSDYLTAAFGGHTFAKSEFTCSAKFGRSKCRLHGEIKKGVIR